MAQSAKNIIHYTDQDNIALTAPRNSFQKTRFDFFDNSPNWQGKLYDDQHNPFNREVKRRKDYIIDMIRKLALPKNCRVLDIGCGCCEYTRDLIALGCDVYGIDLSPGMLHSCQERIRMKDPEFRAHFRHGDIENIPFENESFDLILCVGVLGYLLSDDKALDEITRVIKPHGVFILSEKNLFSLSNLDTLLRRKILSLFARNQDKDFASLLSSVSIRVPWQEAQSYGNHEYKCYNPWMLERHLHTRDFQCIDSRPLGYEFRVIRRYKLLPERLLAATEIFLENLFYRVRIPYFSCSEESYIAFFEKGNKTPAVAQHPA